MSLTDRNNKILDAYRMGTPAKILARKYGLTQGTVHQIAFHAGIRYGCDTALKIADIVKTASHIFGVKAEQIYSDCRIEEVVRARLIIYIVARNAGFSYSAIARRMNRNHATIIKCVRSSSDRMNEHEGFRKMVELLTIAINSKDIIA